jgi:hypothetical protein
MNKKQGFKNKSLSCDLVKFLGIPTLKQNKVSNNQKRQGLPGQY